MLGAIAGDIIGSCYEWDNIKTTDFPLFSKKSHFTDDSVMTIAVGDALMNEADMTQTLQKWARRYPHAGYGGMFRQWIFEENPKPYHSFGNGSAMRVSSAGWLFDTLEVVLEAATASAVVTHNHPEGIKGAQATAAAIFMARRGSYEASFT